MSTCIDAALAARGFCAADDGELAGDSVAMQVEGRDVVVVDGADGASAVTQADASQDHPGRFAPADFARFTCRGSTFVGARGEPFERDRFDDCAGLRAAVAMASNATL